MGYANIMHIHFSRGVSIKKNQIAKEDLENIGMKIEFHDGEIGEEWILWVYK